MTPPSSDAGGWRAKAGIALVALMAVLAVGAQLGYPPGLQPIFGTLIDDQRFAALRAVLPRRGTVGYLSDLGGRFENPRAYYVTQYLLAPVVVAPDVKHDLVVANFASPSDIVRLAGANGLTVVRDFGNGVALLRRREP